MKKNWSILIFVLFILIITSLFSLLVFRYLKNILLRSSTFYKFEKTYWLSFGWIQLEFVKIKYHWPWFEDTINSWSSTNKKNRNCKNCYIQIKNKALSKIVWGTYYSLENKSETCKQIPQNQRISLNKWEWILIPLFKDNCNPTLENKLSGNNLTPINNFSPITLYRDIPWSSYIIWITDWTSNEITGWITTNTPNKKIFNFSFISNTNTFFWLVQNTNTLTKYCLQFNKPVPTNRNYITSTAKYQDFSLTLKWVKYKAVPSFMIYSIIK